MRPSVARSMLNCGEERDVTAVGVVQIRLEQDTVGVVLERYDAVRSVFGRSVVRDDDAVICLGFDEACDRVLDLERRLRPSV